MTCVYVFACQELRDNLRPRTRDIDLAHDRARLSAAAGAQHFATFAGRCPAPNALLLTTVERIGQTRYAHFALAADRFCLAAVFFVVWVENLGVKTLTSTAASPSQIDFGHANPLVLVGQRLELGCHTVPIGKWL